jgi:SAM-dependent methyltransferase
MNPIRALLLLYVAAASVFAGEPAAKEEELPPPMTHYMGRKIAQTMHFSGAPWLVRDSREREEECSTLLKQLAVKPGMNICDMGSGNGFYTLPIAEQTGEKGKVYAIEIQQEMLDMLQQRAGVKGLKNIVSVLGTPVDPKLPAGELDLILCVDVYHEFDRPVPMLAAMHKSLKPDGLVALVEFREEDPKVPIKPEHKMSKKQILKEWEANGFKLEKEFDGLPWQHLMWFKAVPKAK